MSRVADISETLAGAPSPRRGATIELERRVVGFLREQRPEPGSPMGTDQEFIDLTRLSRSTVRRVMERLNRDGWVDRQAGRGTFVGERVLLLDELDGDRNAASDAKHDADERAIREATSARTLTKSRGRTTPRGVERTLRLAVLVSRIEDLAHDWFALGVIAGLDAAAADRGGQIELIGTGEARPGVLAERLTRAEPDALAYLTWRPEYLSLLEVGHRVGFPTIFATTSFARSNRTHSVCEDNEQAVELAVDALWEAGHRRIGLAINRWPEPWVFERHRAFEEAINRRSGHPPELHTAWLDSAEDLNPRTLDRNSDAMADKLGGYLRRHKPTALLSASQITSDALSRLVHRDGLRIPDDLSVVAVDQVPDLEAWLGVEPTVVCLPLGEIGRGLFEAAETIAAAPRTDTTMVARRVPCRLQTGRSVRPVHR